MTKEEIRKRMLEMGPIFEMSKDELYEYDKLEEQLYDALYDELEGKTTKLTIEYTQDRDEVNMDDVTSYYLENHSLEESFLYAAQESYELWGNKIISAEIIEQ